MEKTIKGEIQAVSRYGGIKIGDVWYNPYPKDKEKIVDDKPDLSGAEVELVLDNKGKIVGYTILKEATTRPEPQPVPEPEERPPEERVDEKAETYWEDEKQAIPQKQIWVIRENALRHATNITATYYNNLTSKQREHTTENDLTLAVIEQAEKLEKWIRR